MNISYTKTSTLHLIYSLVPMIILSIVVLAGSTAEYESKQQYYAHASTTALPNNINFNFAAVGDWGCTSATTDTVNNIVDKKPELVLGLGDYSYEDSENCWFKKIQPINNIIKISFGNHDNIGLKELMGHFGLTSEYYSFDYQNVHFIALATESGYLDMSTDRAKEQLAFVKSDLEKASLDPNIDWIIPFFHRIMYPKCECGLVDPFDRNLMDIYHPLFEKNGVNLVLQAHAHTYERTYPLRVNPENIDNPIVTSRDLRDYPGIDGLVIATVGTGGATSTVSHTDPRYRALVYKNLFGFLNVDLSSDGTTLVGTFYDNNGGEIKDQFTITKSAVVEDDLPLPLPPDLPIQQTDGIDEEDAVVP